MIRCSDEVPKREPNFGWVPHILPVVTIFFHHICKNKNTLGILSEACSLVEATLIFLFVAILIKIIVSVPGVHAT